jgi:rhodanese-related sulfurtransferase
LIRGRLRQDLAWAAFILAMATAFGLLYHWNLVKVSFKRELRPYLEKLHTERREQRFQGVKTVSLAQAYALFKEGQTLFVDARPEEEFTELHIQGAVHLTPEMADQRGSQALPGIPRERQIVVYCSQASCDSALKVAEKLQALGFTRVSAFLVGFRAWDESGYPVE